MNFRPKPDQVEAIAENAWLKLAGRAFMVVSGLLAVPVLTGAISWANGTSDDIALLKERMAVVETNGARGRADRIDFQDKTLQGLKELKAGQDEAAARAAETQAQIAAIKATIEAQQKQLDRQRR